MPLDRPPCRLGLPAAADWTVALTLRDCNAIQAEQEIEEGLQRVSLVHFIEHSLRSWWDA